ncbi:MAG: hypothetical protein WCJ64_25055 [Rhodospirillaceae bacterium]
MFGVRQVATTEAAKTTATAETEPNRQKKRFNERLGDSGSLSLNTNKAAQSIGCGIILNHMVKNRIEH